MKRLMTATALVIATATGSFAATEAELLRIQRFVPEATMAELNAIGPATVDSILNVISSGDSMDERRETAAALYRDATMEMQTAAAAGYATDANLIAIQRYVPEATMADLQAMGGATVNSILNEIADGGSEEDTQLAVTSLYNEALGMDRAAAPAGAEYATEANLLKIQDYVPELTMAELVAMGDAKIASILNAISGTDDSSDREKLVKSLVMN